jgi:hypothetical protein
VKLEILHTTLHSLATEHQIASEFGQTRERLGDVLGSCEAILHELAHGLLLGGVHGSQQILDRILKMPDWLANQHELSTWRIELHTIKCLGGLDLKPADLDWLPSTANFRGKRRPSIDSLTQRSTPAELGVAAWLESIIRNRAAHVVESKLDAIERPLAPDVSLPA